MEAQLLVLAISAMGFGIQQLLQVIGDPVVSILIAAVKRNAGEAQSDGTRLLPWGISDVDAKKAMLGSVSILIGLLISASAPQVRVLAAAGLTTIPLWDWLITALTISAGTEGANSVLKLVQYLKDAVKTKTPPSVAQNSPVPQSPSETLNDDGDVSAGGGLIDRAVTPNSGDDIDARAEAGGEIGEGGGAPEGEAVLNIASALATTSAVARPWRAAKSLQVLRNQVNERAPDRSKASDGFIGDAAHASRASDHNPWVLDGNMGVVTAFDITHDPARGCDANELAEAIRGSRDPRVKYIIWNRRIANSKPIGGA